MMLVPLMATGHRGSVVRFSRPLTITYTAILSGVSSGKSNHFAFVGAIENWVYLAVFVSLVLVFVSCRIYEWILQSGTCSVTLWRLCEILLLKGIHHWRYWAVRVVSLTWAFFSFILFNYYSGVMTSFTSVTGEPRYIHNLEDTVNFPRSLPVVAEDNFVHNYLKKSPDPFLNRIWNILSKNPELGINLSDRFSLLMDRIEKQELYYVEERMSILEALDHRFRAHQSCDFAISEPFTWNVVALAFRQTLEPSFVRIVDDLCLNPGLGCVPYSFWSIS